MQNISPLSPAPNAPTTRRLLTPKQIAEDLQCSYSMVLALIRRGALRAVYVGRLPRVRDVDLAAYVDRGGTRGGLARLGVGVEP
jgi:excisionase family DNA binding protein